MRLARHGRKRYAYYHIVIADSRAPRDGRYIERIGMYNPNTNPATIDLDFDKAYDWLTKGAQPTDTVRSILSYKGVLYKKHLMGGVQKGAFNEEEAERRLEKWLNEKEAKIQAKKESIIGEDSVTAKKLLEAETRKKEEKAAAIAAKNAELAEEAKTAAQEETATESAPGENDVADTEKEVVDVPPRKETTDEGSEEKALKDEESKATAEGGSDNSEDKAGESSEREGNEESEEKK
jgi:small subunit ribosomal protein S16